MPVCEANSAHRGHRGGEAVPSAGRDDRRHGGGPPWSGAWRHRSPATPERVRDYRQDPLVSTRWVASSSDEDRLVFPRTTSTVASGIGTLAPCPVAVNWMPSAQCSVALSCMVMT